LSDSFDEDKPVYLVEIIENGQRPAVFFRALDSMNKFLESSKLDGFGDSLEALGVSDQMVLKPQGSPPWALGLYCGGGPANVPAALHLLWSFVRLKAESKEFFDVPKVSVTNCTEVSLQEWAEVVKVDVQAAAMNIEKILEAPGFNGSHLRVVVAMDEASTGAELVLLGPTYGMREILINAGFSGSRQDGVYQYRSPLYASPSCIPSAILEALRAFPAKIVQGSQAWISAFSSLTSVQ
jgi:hypothetical protein